MRARRLTSIVGAAFCAGALVTTWATGHAALHWPRSHEVAAAGERQRQDPTGLAPISTTAASNPRDRAGPAPGGETHAPREAAARSTAPDASLVPRGTAGELAAVEALRARDLVVPVRGVGPGELHDSFAEPRGQGREHEALDILAPRGTPIVAADEGTIAKLFTSQAGGLTIYQFDSSGRYCFYYAHLQAYARGLREGQAVARGEVIGYVGTTGNAPPDTPHLHFAVFVLGPEKRWWQGTAIDPYPLFTG